MARIFVPSNKIESLTGYISLVKTTSHSHIVRIPKSESLPKTAIQYQTHPWSVQNLIRTSIDDQHPGPTKITAHLDHASHCKTASGTNWSKRWTYHKYSPRLNHGAHNLGMVNRLQNAEHAPHGVRGRRKNNVRQPSLALAREDRFCQG